MKITKGVIVVIGPKDLDGVICEALRPISEQLARIEAALAVVLNKEDLMILDFTQLTKSVADESTVEDSVVSLLTQLTAAQKDLQAQLAAAIAANDPAAIAAAQAQIDQLHTQIEDNKAKLVAAVLANTPALANTPSTT